MPECPMTSSQYTMTASHSCNRARAWAALVMLWSLVIGTMGLSTSAAEPTKPLTLPANWPAGTAVQYEIIRVKENVRAGVTNLSRVRTPLTIAVIERTPAGYRLAWTTGRSTVEEPKQLDASQQRLLNIADGLKLILRTDAAGTPEELVNRVEVAGIYKKILGEIRANLAAAGMAAEKIAQATTPVEALAQPERVPAIALKEPNILFLVTGGEFVLGRAREYEDQLPNPLTGKALVTRARMTLKEGRAAAGEALIEWSQEPKALEPNFTLRDIASCLVDTKTGWPKRVLFERTVTVGSAQRIERTELLAKP